MGVVAFNFEIPEQGFEAEKLEAISAVLTHKGQAMFQPQKKFNANNSTSNSNSNKPGSSCKNCNLFRHMQKECNKRKASRAPLIDTQEKPYTP
jgi:hypothetical protein